MMILPSQSRAARALLNWTLADLANAASVGISTVNNFENARRETTAANLNAIFRALTDAGIEFTTDVKRVGVSISVRKLPK